MPDYLHTPAQCPDYALSFPLPFSHRRYFKILANRLRYRYSTNSPYLSQHTFASLADIRIEKEEDLSNVKEAHRVIFCKSTFVEIVLDYITTRNSQCILISGSDDRNLIKDFDLPEALVLWLCQNNLQTKNAKIMTVPIGLEDLRLGRAGKVGFHRYDGGGTIINRVLVPPYSDTNPIRRRVVLSCLSKPGIFDVFRQLLDEPDYFLLTHKYKYVLCLEGNGFDTHRMWETLYRGGFPVLISTPWSRSLEIFKLPLLLVDNPDDISQEILSDFFERNKSFDPRSCEILWAPYWVNLIASKLRTI